MDGWETRRRRGPPGHDWCIIRLGAPGVIRKVTVDTNHFRGNHPDAASLEAASGSADAWVEILPRAPLAGHAENVFPVTTELRATRVRLNIYPDGDVARARGPDTAGAEPTPPLSRPDRRAPSGDARAVQYFPGWRRGPAAAVGPAGARRVRPAG